MFSKVFNEDYTHYSDYHRMAHLEAMGLVITLLVHITPIKHWYITGT